MKQAQHLLFGFMLLAAFGSKAQNVGIGTTTPLMKLHVIKADSAVILLENSQALNTGVSNALYFKTGNGSFPYTGAIKTIGTSSNQARIGIFTFAASSPNGLRERLSITDDGNVGIGNTNPATSALLEVNSTTKGFLPPRMTETQRNAISSPADGLVIFNTTKNGLEFRTSTEWVSLTAAAVTAAVSLPTIVIGTQQWMKENLDVAFYRNGDAIPQVTNPTAWTNLTTGAWCFYNNDSTKGTTYGKLYNWFAVTDPRGLAPTGWHIPSKDEWTTLQTTLGGTDIAGGKMKEAGILHWGNINSPNEFANNNSGWTGLPGGVRSGSGSGGSGNNGFNGNWWSTTDYTSTHAWNIGLHIAVGTTEIQVGNKLHGYSVRCLRD